MPLRDPYVTGGFVIRHNVRGRVYRYGLQADSLTQRTNANNNTKGWESEDHEQQPRSDTVIEDVSEVPIERDKVVGHKLILHLWNRFYTNLLLNLFAGRLTINLVWNSLFVRRPNTFYYRPPATLELTWQHIRSSNWMILISFDSSGREHMARSNSYERIKHPNNVSVLT